jgi:hypothetical protein
MGHEPPLLFECGDPVREVKERQFDAVPVSVAEEGQTLVTFGLRCLPASGRCPLNKK